MKEYFSMLYLYAKQNIKAILAVLIIFSIFPFVLFMYSLPLEPILYAALLAAVFIIIEGILSFRSFCRKRAALKILKSRTDFTELELPDTRNLIERDYQELLELVRREKTSAINEKDRANNELKDYYTIWAHQIKTPIAAMQLLLQTEQASDTQSYDTQHCSTSSCSTKPCITQPFNTQQSTLRLNNITELLDQLFRIEQYVEMALQFLRMESMNADLLLKWYPLDEIIRQAVRKYSKSFIRKKLRLNYESIGIKVLTDEKWLTFVLEQIISNALKYTSEGSISIYMAAGKDCTLVIEDTGIGIEQEDLPRIFERGFTGYNGRADKKSTGIGLYLCKRILTKLSHTILVDSEVGKGTRVEIGLASAEIAAD